MSNLGSAAGLAPLPAILQPTLHTASMFIEVGMAINVASYQFWRGVYKANPFLAPFVP